MKAKAVPEIQDVLSKVAAARKRSRENNFSDLPEDEQHELAASMIACMTRFTPKGSPHYDRFSALVEMNQGNTSYLNLILPGLLRAIAEDFQKDRLTTIQESLHALVFDDLLELAEELLPANPDAAIVVAGAVLEEHVHKLCDKHGLVARSPNGKFISIETLAADLSRANFIQKTDHKAITTWYGIRNDPAHGQLGKHQASEVTVMVQGIRNMILRLPA